MQTRLLSRKTAVVKKYRVQAAETKQNPFQRRLGLVDYGLTVTSGNSGQNFEIRDLTEPAGEEFLTWIKTDEATQMPQNESSGTEEFDQPID